MGFFNQKGHFLGHDVTLVIYLHTEVVVGHPQLYL